MPKSQIFHIICAKNARNPGTTRAPFCHAHLYSGTTQRDNPGTDLPRGTVTLCPHRTPTTERITLTQLRPASPRLARTHARTHARNETISRLGPLLSLSPNLQSKPQGKVYSS